MHHDKPTMYTLGTVDPAEDLVMADIAGYWVTPRSVELLKLAQRHTASPIDLAELAREISRTVESTEDQATLMEWAVSRLTGEEIEETYPLPTPEELEAMHWAEIRREKARYRAE